MNPETTSTDTLRGLGIQLIPASVDHSFSAAWCPAVPWALSRRARNRLQHVLSGNAPPKR